MAEFLYAPNREQVVTTNAWAFLHWLRTARGIDLADWSALQRWSADRAGEFSAAVAAFARLREEPVALVRKGGRGEALVLRKADGTRVGFGWEQIGRTCLRPLPPTPSREGRGEIDAGPAPPPLAGGGWGEGAQPEALPADVATSLTRLWPLALLIRPLAELLLHADLRPDDRLLVVGPSWPWLAALLEGTTVILAALPDVLAVAAEERASVLVAPAQALAEAAFQRPRGRPDLANLRTIIATGGPLSPEGRTRIYTWVKSDLMLLARTGDTFWGNPMEPVLARPPATPAFLKPPASAPVTR